MTDEDFADLYPALHKRKMKAATRKKKPFKKNARSKLKYPALSNMNLKSRMEQKDYDYINKLIAQTKYVDADKAKEARMRKEALDALAFLNKFTEGHIHADFRDEQVNAMFTEEMRKEIYRNNNYRNLDAYGKARLSGRLVDIHTLYNGEENNHYDEFLLDYIEAKELADNAKDTHEGVDDGGDGSKDTK